MSVRSSLGWADEGNGNVSWVEGLVPDMLSPIGSACARRCRDGREEVERKNKPAVVSGGFAQSAGIAAPPTS